MQIVTLKILKVSPYKIIHHLSTANLDHDLGQMDALYDFYYEYWIYQTYWSVYFSEDRTGSFYCYVLLSIKLTDFGISKKIY